MDVLKAEFLPEFLNRIDETIIFHPLGMEELTKIVDIQLRRLQTQLAEAGLTIRRHRRGQAATRRRGVRPGLRRPPAEAGHPAADRQSPGQLPPRKPREAAARVIEVDWDGNEFTFTPVEAEAAETAGPAEASYPSES